MLRFLVPLLLLVASPLAAYRGRPVADISLDGAVSCGSPAVATDGSGFLAVCGPAVQVVSPEGEPRAPMATLLPRSGGFPSLAWIGDRYLLAWSEFMGGVRLATLSREGALLSFPAQPLLSAHHDARIAFDGERILLIANAGGGAGFRTEAFFIDRSLTSASPLGAVWPGFATASSVAATADGFVIAFTSHTETATVALRRDGTIAPPSRVEGPFAGRTDSYQGRSASLVRAGDQTLLVFTSDDAARYDVKVVPLSPSGVPLRDPVVVHGGAMGSMSTKATVAACDSAECQVVVAVPDPVRPSVSTSDALVLRVDPRRLALLETPRRLDAGRSVRPGGIAANERATFAVWQAWTMEYERGGTEALYGRVLGKSGTPDSEPRLLSRRPAPQTLQALGASRVGALALYSEETIAEGRVVRAASLDGNGRARDALPLTLGAVPSFGGAAVAATGRGHLAAWAERDAIRGAHIGPDGVPQRFTIADRASGRSVVAAHDGSSTLVAWGTYGIDGAVVGPDGTAGAVRPLAAPRFPPGTIAAGHEHPSLAWNGSHYLLVWLGTYSYPCAGIPCPATGRVHARRIARDGTPIDAEPVDVHELMSMQDLHATRPGVASDGRDFLVVWNSFGIVFGARVTASLGIEQFEIAQSTSYDVVPSVAWDGSRYIVAFEPAGAGSGLAIRAVTATGVVQRIADIVPRAGERLSLPMLASAGDGTFVAGFTETADGLRRAALLTSSEITVASTLAVPSGVTAFTDGSEIRVRWSDRSSGETGHAIETRLPDGTWAAVALAPADATSATFPHREGIAVIRVTAWNAAAERVSSEERAVNRLARRRSAGLR